MADLLLELFSEEIPARMQTQAAKDLERLVVGALSDRGLLFEGVKTFAGPRRLSLAIAGLPARQPDVSEELKGPKADAPQAAIDGFLKKTGLTLEQLEARDVGKAKVYFAVVKREGRATAEVLAEVLPELLARLPWPKSMRFPGSSVRWVRPLHDIVCTLDGEMVPFSFAGIASGDTTYGHRFLSKGPLRVRRFDDYEKALRDGHVVLDGNERRDIITNDLKQKSFALGLDTIVDDGLLDEVAGLAEWPTVLIGTIEDQFMDVPPEILQTSMRTHQKYFSLRDPKTGRMANRFALVSNMLARDGGSEIVAGNERVLRARLSDAKFFWDQDRKTSLLERLQSLKSVVFHARLGTQYQRVNRITFLAMVLARHFGENVAQAHRAAWLSKSDLVSGIVGEFPELQGTMGRYYAIEDGEDVEVADAIGDQYRPAGASDTVPDKKLSRILALADKLDSLIGLWRAGEKPTGSKDPFALRRAALGVIRIVLDNTLRVPLTLAAKLEYLLTEPGKLGEFETRTLDDLSNEVLLVGTAGELFEEAQSRNLRADEAVEWAEIVSFIADRLKVALRERGTRHDLIDAVFSVGKEDDLVRLVARVEALQAFLKTDEGANLLAGYKRAANILKAEEKKDKVAFAGAPDPESLSAPEERALYVELAAASEMIRAEVGQERFVEAMSVMARLRGPVDAFFDKVKVNDDDPKIRENRLKLLAHLRATLHLVADFSRIEG
jgi:glycyl-tRNA synthetase beta chain